MEAVHVLLARVWCCWCCHLSHAAQRYFHVVAFGRSSSSLRSSRGSSCNRCCTGTSGPQQTCHRSRSGHSCLPVLVELTLLVLLQAVHLVALVTLLLLLHLVAHLEAAARLLLKQHPDQLEHQERMMHQAVCLEHKASCLEHRPCLQLECPVAVVLMSLGQLLEQPAVVRPVVALALPLLVRLQQQR